MKEIRGTLPKKKKMPQGWPVCLKRMPSKVGFQNNDIYELHTNDEEHHYKELKEKEESQEEREPKEKNMQVFLQIKHKR